ncbi:MAG TPA: helix-turn-helix domain-containing protein [Polyangiaceae bacterium]|nr:helix-turn-helix domain-containing protein [Polyangiaceae bacterium]
MVPRDPRNPNPPSAPAPSRPRRGRPPTIDSQRLLSVARDVFLERGIRATTLEVAERAGVSEGALFHRFKSKEALFSAAMDFDHEEAPRRMLQAIAELEQPDELEPRAAIIRLATLLIEIGRRALPLMMMSWSNPQPLFEKKHSKFKEVVLALRRYFERQMQLGKLRQMDAEVLARTLLGSVHHFVLASILLDDGESPFMSESEYVRGLADLLLTGALALGAPSRNTRLAAP